MSLSLRKVGGNALSILTSDVMNRATSFVLYAMVARNLGAFEFGQLSLALTLFYVFQVSAVAGLKILIVRQVAKDRSQTRLYFINGCMIVVLSSLLSLCVLYAFVRLLHYPPATNLVILLLSLGLLPYAISAVCEGVFQAWERMRYIAYVNVPVNIAKMIGAYLLLSRSQGLYTVILILLSSFFTIAVVEVWLLLRRFPSQQASISFPFSIATLRSASTFLGIDGAVAIESSLNVILLSKLATETQVGLYSAATQLMVPLVLVYQSIAQSIFPVMCRRVEPGFQALKRIAEQAIEMLLVLALPTVAGIFFLGPWALSVLYKNRAFLQAVPALRIVAWILILLAGSFLISRFGLRGAAMTLLLTRLAACIQHYVPVARLFSGISLAEIAWKPILAAVCMAGYLALPANRVGILAGFCATLIYVAALIALTIWACGGLRQFKEKYFVLLSE